MRLVVYNIRYGAGTGWRLHLPFPGAGLLRQPAIAPIGAYLNEVEPDVVALLEVDGGSRRAAVPQAEVLAGALGAEHAFRCKYGAGSLVSRLPLFRAQGNALLSRRPLTALRFHELSVGTKRLVIEAELDALALFVVHLALRPHYRRRQLAELAELVRAARRPAIVAGDLNTLAPTRELAPFLAATGLRPAGGMPQPSWPAHRPRLALDHVLVAPELRGSRAWVPDVRHSDHRPLDCDVA
jgi:endonuclease/exonuclease/phosphatase family metal-dependent hydrolase